jgi:outer membrane receptor protein involved in Fe transport
MKSTGLRIPSAISFALWAVITNCEAAAAGNADSPAGAAVLQEVTVTAQRREENISRVPISISAFSQADLDARDMKTLGDIASATPGVDFRPVGYSNWFTIRGISQNAGGGVAGLGPNTTALYVDDAPLQARYANAAVPTAVPYVFDIDHIEVLRGPQGTLFGASAEGGAIRVISHAPSLTEFSGLMRAEGSQIDGGGINTEFGAAAGGPIIQDKLGFRVSAWWVSHRRTAFLVARSRETCCPALLEARLEPTSTRARHTPREWRCSGSRPTPSASSHRSITRSATRTARTSLTRPSEIRPTAGSSRRAS